MRELIRNFSKVNVSLFHMERTWKVVQNNFLCLQKVASQLREFLTISKNCNLAFDFVRALFLQKLERFPRNVSKMAKYRKEVHVFLRMVGKRSRRTCLISFIHSKAWNKNRKKKERKKHHLNKDIYPFLYRRAWNKNK